MSEQQLIDNILTIPEETQTIEFKRLGEVKVVSKVIETIVAMTNTDGGRIILGVDDPEKSLQEGIDRIYGIEESNELYDEIIHHARNIVPPVPGVNIPKCIKVKGTNKTLAIIDVPKATNGFHSVDNNVWIRLRKSNKRLSPQELIKMNYAKGFVKADRELVEVDFELLDTPQYHSWKAQRGVVGKDIQTILFKLGLARKQEGTMLPTRAAVLLFAEFPTTLMETKCAVRVLQYDGTIATYGETPNMVGLPINIEGPIADLIEKTHITVLQLLRTGIEMKKGFVTKYRIPERAVKEAITNAVIHRDYHIKRDIEIGIFEDRIEVKNPGLFPYNITASNIGTVRSEGYRNDLLVKHLRDFPSPPNLDQNEGVIAMRNEMAANNLFPPIYFTYPIHQDSVEIMLLNEFRSSEWDKVKEYLHQNKYIDNKTARDMTGVSQIHTMSKFLARWTEAGLLIKIIHKSGSPKFTKYKLANADEIIVN